MLEQAVLADQLGYDAVSFTKQHLMDLMAATVPLHFAIKIASYKFLSNINIFKPNNINILNLIKKLIRSNHLKH